MMSSNDIVFDENLELYTSIKDIKDQVCIILSDALNSSEEELSEKYKSQIASFINSSSDWYEKAIGTVKDWARKKYNVEAVQKSDIELMNIFILYEQNEKELFGLQFRVAFDIEHGCGLKLNTDGYQILEVGESDVAFC